MASEVLCSKSAVSNNQDKWAEKLKETDLSQFKLVRVFAKGGYGHVALVQLRDDPNSAFGLKVIQKAKIKNRACRQDVLSEKKLLSEVQSDFIIKLYKTFKDKKYLYFLTEYCPGGDLFIRGRFLEEYAKFYIACTVEALDCLHSLNIVHNDIKPGNLVMDAEGYVKVIDLGLSQKLERGKLASKLIGSAEIMAPEISHLTKENVFNGHDRGVDLWALGMLLYVFLRGTVVDKNGNRAKICKDINEGIDSARFPKQYFTEDTKSFIRELCAYEPNKRLGYESIQEIREHRWLENFNWVDLRTRQLEPPFIPRVDSAIDTQNFKGKVSIIDLVCEEDESDWDKDF